MTQHESRTTRDHDEIRRWVEERGGTPASVRGTAAGDDAAGILRIDFPGRGEDQELEHVSWDEFFAKFDESDLTFLYQDKTSDGGISRFNKFIHEGRDSGRGDDEIGQQGREGRGAAESESMKRDRDRGSKGR